MAEMQRDALPSVEGEHLEARCSALGNEVLAVHPEAGGGPAIGEGLNVAQIAAGGRLLVVEDPGVLRQLVHQLLLSLFHVLCGIEPYWLLLEVLVVDFEFLSVRTEADEAIKLALVDVEIGDGILVLLHAHILGLEELGKSIAFVKSLSISLVELVFVLTVTLVLLLQD